MRNIDPIPDAITDLEGQEALNVKAVAEKYDIERKMLKNRWKGNRPRWRRLSLRIVSTSLTHKRRHWFSL